MPVCSVMDTTRNCCKSKSGSILLQSNHNRWLLKRPEDNFLLAYSLLEPRFIKLLFLFRLHKVSDIRLYVTASSGNNTVSFQNTYCTYANSTPLMILKYFSACETVFADKTSFTRTGISRAPMFQAWSKITQN